MTTHKLISAKGTLLGTITYPEYWEMERNSHRGSVRRAYCLGLSFREMQADVAIPLMTPTVKQFVIERGHSFDYPDAVMLWGITPEEFEQMPGCSFAPGAGYLRSLVEGG